MENIFTGNVTVRGYNHIKVDKICQDFSGAYQDENLSMVAVADGHGSDKYIRSDRGSKIAVNSAFATIKGLVCEMEESGDFYDLYEIERALTKGILNQWHIAVDDDFNKDPFEEEDIKGLNEATAASYLDGSDKDHAYGSTLLAFFNSKSLSMAIQIGDGDLVAVNERGDLYMPVPEDKDCVFNKTTSLCGSNAGSKFRFYAFPTPPAAVFLSTDGMINSFANKEDFFDMYRECIVETMDVSPESTLKELSESLPICSKKGSGDDMSVAMWMDLEKMRCFYENYKKPLKMHALEHEMAVKMRAIKKSYRTYIETSNPKDFIPVFKITPEDLPDILEKEAKRAEEIQRAAAYEIERIETYVKELTGLKEEYDFLLKRMDALKNGDSEEKVLDAAYRPAEEILDGDYVVLSE